MFLWRVCLNYNASFQTDQGIKNYPVDKAAVTASTNPDYAVQDFYDAIANKNFVSSFVNLLFIE